MKYLILASLFMSSAAFAYAEIDNNEELICTTMKDTNYNTKAVAISCVSKASIELAKAQLKLVKLQIKELEEKAKAVKNEQK